MKSSRYHYKLKLSLWKAAVWATYSTSSDLTANVFFLFPLKAKFSLVRTELDWKGTGCLQMPNHT